MVLAGGTSLMAQDPVDFNGWLKQGVRQVRGGQYPEAVVSFERAVALDYSKPIAHLYLGTAYLGQYIPSAEGESPRVEQRAEDEFQRVLAWEPSNKLALSSIAWLKLSQHNLDEALDWYGKIIRADPSNADAYYTVGFILWSKWYPIWAQARSDAGLAPETSGPIPDAAVRSFLWSRYGAMLQTAIDSLSKALEINPRSTDATAYLNLLIRERAELRDTAAEYQQDLVTAEQWMQKASDMADQREMFAYLVPPPSPPPPDKRVQLAANAAEANIVTRIPPVRSNFRGDVILAVTIDSEGNVTDVRMKEGHPMLIGSAIDAVQQWKFRRTLVNGSPVGVQNIIKVTF